MNPKYDSQIQNLENEARQAKEEEYALMAILQKNTAEIQQLKGEIVRSESEKKILQQQLAAQSAQMNQAPGFSVQSPQTGNIIKKIEEIERMINALISRIGFLEAENSLIQTSKLSAAKQRLAEALSQLSQLKSELLSLGRTYHNASQQLYGTRMKEAKEAQSYLDQGASVAKDQYDITLQRVTYIDRVIGQYHSSSGSNQFTGTTLPGSYFVTPYISNNYSLLNGKSIDSALRSYNSEASISPLERFFDTANSTPSASCLRQYRNPVNYNYSLANRQANRLMGLEYRLNSKDQY